MDWLGLDVQLLLGTAVTIGVVHTLIGPDHYLPFIAIARERGWSLRRTLAITAGCGVGHCLASVVLGVIGIAFGLALAALEFFQETRGNAAAWLLLGFGLAYATWSRRRRRRGETHTHRHAHRDGTVHTHAHAHGTDDEHLHVHAQAGARPLVVALLVIFLLGPCEALIPLLMYPAAKANVLAVVAVAVVFSLATVATMLACVAVGLKGANGLRIPHSVSGVATGAIISVCAIAMLVGL